MSDPLGLISDRAHAVAIGSTRGLPTCGFSQFLKILETPSQILDRKSGTK